MSLRATPNSLSVCMIVKNEAATIVRCLSSIKPAAHEIIVVDTGSLDDTVALTKSLGVTVIQSDWRDDFSYSRNISLKAAKGTWILWLDADDVVPAASLQKIKDLSASAPDRVYGFIIKNEKPGNTGSEFMQARMFPNRPDIYFERRIHEQMMLSALRIGMHMQETDVVIEHHGYADAEKVKEKSARNVGLLLAEWDSSRPDAVMAIEIADSYYTLGDNEKARQWYKTVLSVPCCEDAMPHVASQAYLGLGNIANKNEKFKEAILFLEKAVTLCKDRSDALFSLAVAQDLSGDLTAAARTLFTLISKSGPTLTVGVDYREATIKAYLRLERILTELGKEDELFALAQKARIELAHRPEIQNMAGRVLYKNKKLMDALHAFEKSLEIEPRGNCEAYIGLCIIYAAAGRKDHAEATLRTVQSQFETRPLFWAYWHMIFPGDSLLRTDTAAIEKETQTLKKLFL